MAPSYNNVKEAARSGFNGTNHALAETIRGSVAIHFMNKIMEEKDGPVGPVKYASCLQLPHEKTRQRYPYESVRERS